MNLSKTVWKMEYFSFLVRFRLMIGFMRELRDLLKATPLFLKKTVRIDSASACSWRLAPQVCRGLVDGWFCTNCYVIMIERNAKRIVSCEHLS